MFPLTSYIHTGANSRNADRAIGQVQAIASIGQILGPAVLMVAVAVSPHDAWQQSILRLFDTAVRVGVGIGVAIAASFSQKWVTSVIRSRDDRDPADRTQDAAGQA